MVEEEASVEAEVEAGGSPREAEVEAEVEAGVFPLEAEDVAAVDFKYFAISMEIRYILLSTSSRTGDQNINSMS